MNPGLFFAVLFIVFLLIVRMVMKKLNTSFEIDFNEQPKLKSVEEINNLPKRRIGKIQSHPQMSGIETVERIEGERYVTDHIAHIINSK